MNIPNPNSDKAKLKTLESDTNSDERPPNSAQSW